MHDLLFFLIFIYHLSVHKCHSHFTGDFSAVKRGIPALAEKRILVNHVRLVRVKNNDVCDLSRLNISMSIPIIFAGL